MSGLPEEVRAALLGARPPGYLHERVLEISPSEGDVVLIDLCPPSGDRCIGMVTGVDTENEVILVHLASNDLAGATDLDAVVSGLAVGLPFDLLVEGEVYGPIFTEQVASVFGRVEVRLADAISSSVVSDGYSLVGRAAGLPLGGDRDPRRAFKRFELERFEPFITGAYTWLGGLSADVLTLHPDSLMPPASGSDIAIAQERALEVLELIDEYREVGLCLPSALLEVLDDDLLFDEMARWMREFHIDLLSPLERIRDHSDERLVIAGPDTGPSGPFDRYIEAISGLGRPTVQAMATRSSGVSQESWITSHSSTNGRCRIRIVVPQKEFA